MPKAPFSSSETERLRVLHQCCILDTEPEEVFDDLTRLAARLCKAPIALISLVDEQRQWFKSTFGLEVKETHRDWAFCAHAILGTEPFIIPDAAADPRTCDNALVTGPPYIQFYAGIPLRTSDGYALGTLCVIDVVPRDLSDEQLDDLKSLANQATGQIEFRRITCRLAEEKLALANSLSRMDQIAAQVPGAVYQYLLRPDGTSCLPYASRGIHDIFRVTPEEVHDDASKIFATVHPDDHDDVVASIQESARTLQPWRCEFRVRFDDNEVRWISGNSMPTRRSDRSVLWHGFVTDVTDQRLERDATQRVQAQLQAIVDASTQVAIITTDLQGTITLFNSGAEQMLGYSAQEMVGLQTPSLIHLESEVQSRSEQLSRQTGRDIKGFDTFVEYARQGRHDAREWTYIRKDGSRLTVSLAVTGIRNSDNTLTGFLGVATDVTGARKAEIELRTERERLDLALTGAQLGTWDWNVQTGEELLDSRWAAIVGEKLENLQSHVGEWLSRVHPDDVDRVWKNVEDHFMGITQVFETQYRLRHADGSYRWVVARGRLVERGRRGNPLRMVGTLADVTVRLKAENEAKAYAQLLHQFITCTPAAVAMLDNDMRYLQVSERWSQDYQIPYNDIVGRSHYDVFPDMPERWKQIHKRVLGGTTESCVEDRFDRSDGSTMWLQWEARPWYNAANEIGGLILFTQVITKRKQTEADLIAAREAAEAANRSKSDFLANMSHEIRTPLTSILGYTDILSESSLSEDDRDFALKTIKRSGIHLLRVINDILDLSKIEAGKMTLERIPFSPAVIVEEVLSYFQEQAQSKNLMLTAVAEGLIPKTICSDPVRLRQILVNLIGNAIKFTEFGGIRVVVRLQPSTPDEPSRLAFEIHDSGIGISGPQLKTLFAPFVQGDGSATRTSGGTGLGLAICRRMARLLQGDVTVESILNAGSVFTVTIATGPLNGIEMTTSLVAPLLVTTPIPTLKLSGRILLAEDSPLNHRLISTMLTKAGAVVDIVENGHDAVEKATASLASPYDLVLMDIQMPIIDGYAASKILRSRGFKAPIIALTANAMIEDRERCLAAGCNDFMTKPIDRTRLLSLCDDWLTKSKSGYDYSRPIIPADRTSSHPAG